MSQVKIKHSHGITETHATLADALEALRTVYGAEIEIEGEISEGRVLVWRDAVSAQNDDGARAVAVISATHQL